jgi:hypothetical protein
MKYSNIFTVMLMAVVMAFAAMGCSSQASNEQAAEQAANDLANALSGALTENAAPAVEPLTCGEGTQMVNMDRINVQLCYPSNWTAEKDPELEIILFSELEGNSDIFQENVNVVTENLPYSMTASEYMDASMTSMSTMLQNFRKIDRGSQEIRGRKAEWLIYHHEMESYKIRVKAWTFTKGSTAYVLTGSAMEDSFDKFEKEFDAIASTMNFGG